MLLARWCKLLNHGEQAALQSMLPHSRPCFLTVICFALRLQVIKESSGDNCNSLGAASSIQIPPPRPKRKPVHPYPRKLGSTASKNVPALKQLEKPQLQVQSLYDQDNGSPTSVLTVPQIRADTLGSESGGSPTSTIDIEERCPTPSIATAELAMELPPTNDEVYS